jgi:hypothetical protein
MNEVPMTHYRLYYRTEARAQVRGFEPIEAENDTKAINEAEAKQRAIAVELWCAHRLVKQWSLVGDNKANQRDESLFFKSDAPEG